jgi:carboxypeptidase family protein/AhpC/TSA family protein
MRTAWVALLYVLVVSAAAGQQANEKVKLTGEVTDEAGEPVAGATVEAYGIEHGSSRAGLVAERMASQETGADGAFSLEFQTAPDARITGILVARKEGLALSWHNWQAVRREAPPFSLVLGEPATLTGRVVDPDGRPIAGAEVRAMLMIEDRSSGTPRMAFGAKGLEAWLATTGPDGAFRFTDVPADARAEYLVAAPGRAATMTLDSSQSGMPRLKFAAGEEPATIVLQPEARIEGRVIEKATGKPVGGAGILAGIADPRGSFEAQEGVAGPDGRFAVGGLRGGSYLLRLASKPHETPEWIHEEVSVTTQTGQTVRGVEVALSKGAILEVRITDEVTGEPVPGAYVSAYRTSIGRSISARTDETGLARLRLPADAYRRFYVHKPGYGYLNETVEALQVEEGQTYEQAFALTPPKKAHGVVVDPSGEPAAGVAVRLLPGGSETARTGAKGQFEVTAEFLGSGHNLHQKVLAAWDEERALAGAVEIDEEQQDPVRLQLSPAPVAKGKVTKEDGSPLADVRVTLMLRAGNWGSSLRSGGLVTDRDGCFQTMPLPKGYRYSIAAQAVGFGQEDVEFEVSEDQTEAIEIEAIALPLADLSISGVVVDRDDEPVANAQVSVYGDAQPHRSVRADKEGRFRLEGIVHGKVHIHASARTEAGQQRCSVEAEGGATDVMLVLGQRVTPGRPAPPRIPKLLGKPLPDLARVKLGAHADAAKGKRVVLCFWDYEQRPARRMVRQLADMAAELESEDVVVLTAHASPVDQTQLRDWAAAQDMALPIGLAGAEADDSAKTCRAFGVRAIPWLILTDKAHIVRAEGLTLPELRKMLQP